MGQELKVAIGSGPSSREEGNWKQYKWKQKRVASCNWDPMEGLEREGVALGQVPRAEKRGPRGRGGIVKCKKGRRSNVLRGHREERGNK